MLHGKGILMKLYAEMTVEGASSKKTLTFGDKLFDKIICLPGGFEQMLGANRTDMELSDCAEKETGNLENKQI